MDKIEIGKGKIISLLMKNGETIYLSTPKNESTIKVSLSVRSPNVCWVIQMAKYAWNVNISQGKTHSTIEVFFPENKSELAIEFAKTMTERKDL